MKKFIAFILLACMLLTLCACGKKEAKPAEVQPTEAPATETPAPEVQPAPEAAETPTPEVVETPAPFEFVGLPEEITAFVNETMSAVNEVRPGSAGSSLRTMAAAGHVLDLSKIADGCDRSEFVHTCWLWLQNNIEDEQARENFSHSWYLVWEKTTEYMADPETMAGEAESCGYDFDEEYDADQVEWVLNCMAISQATGE